MTARAAPTLPHTRATNVGCRALFLLTRRPDGQKPTCYPGWTRTTCAACCTCAAVKNVQYEQSRSRAEYSTAVVPRQEKSECCVEEAGLAFRAAASQSASVEPSQHKCTLAHVPRDPPGPTSRDTAVLPSLLTAEAFEYTNEPTVELRFLTLAPPAPNKLPS